jgi:hypothetical protein
LRLRTLAALTELPDTEVAEFCRNFAVRHSDRRARIALVARDRTALADALARPLPPATAPPASHTGNVFFFSGKGTAGPE